MTQEERNHLIEVLNFTNIDKPQKDEIFALYRKYVDSNVFNYVEGCGCKADIQNMFRDLKTWYENNN